MVKERLIMSASVGMSMAQGLCTSCPLVDHVCGPTVGLTFCANVISLHLLLARLTLLPRTALFK